MQTHHLKDGGFALGAGGAGEESGQRERAAIRLAEPKAPARENFETRHIAS